MDNQHQGFSDSPNSSEGVESHHGTPATKLSAFSPDDVQLQQSSDSCDPSRKFVPPLFTLRPVPVRSSPTAKVQISTVFGNPDPFTTASTANFVTKSFHDTPRLSPIASTFTPIGLRENASDRADNSTSTVHSPTFMIDANLSNVGSSTASLEPNTASSQPELRKLMYSVANSALLSPISHSSGSSSKASSTGTANVNFGQFSSESKTSRCLMISQVAPSTSIEDFDTFFNDYSSLRRVVLSELLLTGTIYASFTDIRDAGKAYDKIQSVRQDWNVQHIANTPIDTQDLPEDLACLPGSIHDGQIVVKADHFGPELFRVGDIGSLVKDLLANYGDIKAYSIDQGTSPFVTYRAEFYNTIAADNALAYLNGFKLAGFTLTIMRYQPRRESVSQRPTKDQGPLVIGQENSGLENAFGNMSVSGRQEYYDAGVPNTAFVSPYFPPNPGSRSLSYRRDIAGQQLPSALDNCRFNGYVARSSSSSPQWSPVYSPFPDGTLQSPCWAAYSPGAYSPSSYSPGMYNPYGYSPGAIGQERIVHHTPQPRALYCLQQQRGLTKLVGRQNHDYASVHHNVVDVDRIRQGTDVRTTIMLRNIPNKIDQAMLKEIVDETSFGKYDFMYLRIDFANNCNVGYAFINFEDPYFIIDFVNARAGHRWNRYNSDKVAEVSYATIQGRDCLVQKFRNSSVMLEHPSFRPKIFNTGSGPISGSEDKFPGPDNPSKMRRSVENAEHVGLFAPRAGQNFRDEQRRRRSQYDRGTRLAEIEDAYYLDDQDHKVDKNHYSNRFRGQSHSGFEVY